MICIMESSTTNDAAVLNSPKDDEPVATSHHSLPTIDQARMTPSTDLSMVKAVPPFDENDTRAILRQFEFYFSDQNLPQDRHLLGLANGDGNGAVSINEICSWKRLRPYRKLSKTAIPEILKQSAVLDIEGKKVKRRFPLTVKLLVEPEIDVVRDQRDKILASNPHLTKNMLKPTGYEEGFVDSITPDEHEKNLTLYNPEYSFWQRIENAIAHYQSKRKKHQKTQHIFNLWMSYGGITSGPSPFSGGATDAGIEELDKEEALLVGNVYAVDPQVLQDDQDWIVDFEAVALGFLSTEFLSWCEWDDPEQVKNVCNVMNNFFSFLLRHEVCPEYVRELHAARRAVDEAAIELHALPKADKEFNTSHSFNAACRLLSQEMPIVGTGSDWDDTATTHEDAAPLTEDEALIILFAGLSTFDMTHHLEARSPPLENAKATLKAPSVRTYTIGMEVTAVELAEGTRADFFTLVQDTVVPRMGIMRCKHWIRPYEPAFDRPYFVTELPETFELIINETALLRCTVGMKLDAQIKVTESGLCWIDELYNLHPSFYTWLPNTRLGDIKQRMKDLEEVKLFLTQNPDWTIDDIGMHKTSVHPPVVDTAAVH